MEFELGVHDTDGRDQKNSMGFHHFEAFTVGAANPEAGFET